MNETIKAAIIALAEKAKNACSPDEAMKYAQAASNLSHAGASIAHVEDPKI